MGPQMQGRGEACFAPAPPGGGSWPAAGQGHVGFMGRRGLTGEGRARETMGPYGYGRGEACPESQQGCHLVGMLRPYATRWRVLARGEPKMSCVHAPMGVAGAARPNETRRPQLSGRGEACFAPTLPEDGSWPAAGHGHDSPLLHPKENLGLRREPRCDPLPKSIRFVGARHAVPLP